jgi:hypothetical protein
MWSFRLVFQLPYRWRISAGYSTGGYPPVASMPYSAPNLGVTRRNISHTCHGWGGHAGSPNRMGLVSATSPVRM